MLEIGELVGSITAVLAVWFPSEVISIKCMVNLKRECIEIKLRMKKNNQEMISVRFYEMGGKKNMRRLSKCQMMSKC